MINPDLKQIKADDKLIDEMFKVSDIIDERLREFDKE